MGVVTGTTGQGRRSELETNLAAVRARLASACVAAGRDPTEVTLVAVTKTYPASDVEHLAALGVRDIGENRDQEAAPKASEVAAAGVDVRWHFVGRLQRNKARSVASYADLVHTVDGVRLADALAEAARRANGVLDVLVQVSIDGDLARGGAWAGSGRGVGRVEPASTRASDEAEADRVLDRVVARVAESDALVLRGLMAIAPLDWEPDRAFASLAAIAEKVRAAHPSATVLSAGMSGDMESAVHYGATHVRVGTALLGNRPPLM